MPTLYREMTAKATRVLYNTIKYITVIAWCVIGIVILCIAGTSDFYIMELKQAVPGDMDLKVMHIVFLILPISTLGIYIIKYADFSAMYDLERVPIRWTSKIDKAMKRNVVFSRQVT